MIRTLSILLTIALPLSLSACSDDNDAPATRDNNDRLFDTQRDALDKAREVEGLLQNNKEQLDRDIEAQTAH